ncbi:hypothetical protein FGO68_gene7421 [Halteria grandinella]|uniref:Protein ARV n=1 Tax=Halteria grandinella TaxID=5974 RepID=A0A8J8NEN6_HALGN|nr:hypothetical protein FGO68_gene7421 [Halteria grandinella]
MSLNVCVQCGAKVRRLIRKLQFDNYCLEKCPDCQQEADRFLEYERNLKILNILLCNPQIYRHIFFNHDTIKKIGKYCILFTLCLLFMLYWHQSRERNIQLGLVNLTPAAFVAQSLNRTAAETFSVMNQTDCMDNCSISLNQRKLKILSTIDLSLVKKTAVQHLSYILTVVVITYLIKKFQFMRRSTLQAKTNVQNFELLMRIWYVFILSNVGLLGIGIEVVWNYPPLFFVILRTYSFYSNFICIGAIINLQIEKLISVFIIMAGYFASQACLSLYTSNGFGSFGSTIMTAFSRDIDNLSSLQDAEMY